MSYQKLKSYECVVPETYLSVILETHVSFRERKFISKPSFHTNKYLMLELIKYLNRFNIFFNNINLKYISASKV